MADKILTLEQVLSELKNYNHNELHVHHTWKPDHSNWESKPDGLYWNQSMRNYHIKTRGFVDIAQHLTLLPNGLFVTGRAFDKTPASIQGHNTTHGLPLMVEMIGNFDIGHDKFEGAQKDSMLELARWFDSRGKYIRFHNENSAKSCPGTGINKGVFMNQVRNIIEKGDDRSMSNPYTRAIQASLRDYGINPGPIDGIPGPMTLAAVRQALKLLTLAQQKNTQKNENETRLNQAKELAKKIIEI